MIMQSLLKKKMIHLLNGLIKHEPENGKFFEDCIDELKKNWDVFNTMTLEDIQSILNKL